MTTTGSSDGTRPVAGWKARPRGASGSTRFDRVGVWLASHRRLALLAIIVVSAGLRIGAYRELCDGPLLQLQRFDQTDMNFFDSWAKAIAGGDWWTAAPRHPLHNWHVEVAQAWLHPDDHREPQVIAHDAKARTEAAALWNTWYGGAQFHQEPLYPYLMALTYTLTGADPRHVIIWQLALGVLANVLIWQITRSLFGDGAAALAAVAALLCAPLLYAELQLLRTSLTVFFALALTQVLVVVWQAPTRRRVFGLGVLLGMSMTLLTTLAAAGLVFVEAARMRSRARRAAGESGRGPLAASFAVLALGCALPLLPVVVRNLHVGAPWLSLTSVAPITFAATNHAGYDPLDGWEPTGDNAARVAGIMGASEGAMPGAVKRTMATHGSIGSFAALVGRKAMLLANAREMPNNENLAYAQLWSRVLRSLPVGFGFVMPLGIVGLVVGWRRRDLTSPGGTGAARTGARWLTAMVIVTGAPMLALYVLARFRAPMLALLIPPAAFLVVQGATWLRAREFHVFAAAAASVAVLAAVSFWPLPSTRPLVRHYDWIVPWEIWYAPLHTEALAQHDDRMAAALMREFLSVQPPVVQAAPAAVPEYASETELVALYADFHHLFADDLRRIGDTTGAARQDNIVVDLLNAANHSPSRK